MRKSINFLMLLSIFLSACNSNSSTVTTPTSLNISSSPVESTPVSGTSTPQPSEPNVPAQKVMTKQEIFDFDLIRSDWTKEQMIELGLKKEVNDLGGETYFSDGLVRYTYYDYFEEKTPAVVDVLGDHLGPRGIRVGDTFEEVMTLFPQNEDWKSNANGVFYGEYNPDAEQVTWGPSGYVTAQDDGIKEITIITDVYPFVRMFFKDDVLTNYTFFLISAE